jgi:hypothetical protein
MAVLSFPKTHASPSSPTAAVLTAMSHAARQVDLVESQVMASDLDDAGKELVLECILKASAYLLAATTQFIARCPLDDDLSIAERNQVLQLVRSVVRRQAEEAMDSKMVPEEA